MPALCLGWYSGQAGMVAGDSDTGLNSVRKSRQAKGCERSDKALG